MGSLEREQTSVGREAVSASSKRKPTDVHFSSATDEWATPQWLFALLAWIFGGFDLDPCATAANAKCAKCFTKAENGLSQP
jgi:hypothetical protein